METKTNSDYLGSSGGMSESLAERLDVELGEFKPAFQGPELSKGEFVRIGKKVSFSMTVQLGPAKT